MKEGRWLGRQLLKYPFWTTLLLHFFILGLGISAALTFFSRHRQLAVILAFTIVTGLISLIILYLLVRRINHHQVQELLREHRQLNLIFNALEELLILKDRDRHWLQANRSVHEVLGLPDNWQGQKSEEMDKQVNRTNSKRIYAEEQLLLTGQPQQVEMKSLNRKTNRVRRLDLNYSLLRDELTNEEYILVYGRDNTKRREVETELRLAKEQLEAVIGNIAEAIIALNLERRIIKVNNAFERMYGWKAEEILGQKASVIIPETHMARAKALVAGLEEGESFIGIESAGLKKDGEIFDVSITLSPIRSPYGKIEGYTGILRDISERKRNEELLRKSEMLSVIGQMAAGVAHEIRNPLTSLKGFIQLIKSGDELKEKYIEIILSELERINMIVNEFMVLAKPQVSKPSLANFNRLLEDVVTLTSTQAVINNVNIEQLHADALPSILCEENQIKQVFLNIIKNAIEAMPQGGLITIQSNIEHEETEKPTLKIIVSDTGTGISKERLANLGEPFYTTKEKGTGLGLMVSMRIIRAHGGDITFASEEGLGTTVTVMLPFQRESFRLAE